MTGSGREITSDQMRETEQLKGEAWGDGGEALPAAPVNSEQDALQEVAEQTAYGEVFLSDLISRQLALSLTVGTTFLLFIFALPLFNYFVPSIANIRVFGFTLSWLVLGVCSYPLIWVLAYYFVGTSKKNEDDFTRLVK